MLSAIFVKGLMRRLELVRNEKSFHHIILGLECSKIKVIKYILAMVIFFNPSQIPVRFFKE